MLIVFFVLITFFATAQESARIIESSVSYHIESDQSVAIEKFVKIRVFDEQGYSHGVFTEFSDKFRRIDQVSIEVFNAQGERVKKLKRNDGLEIGFNPSYEISDARVLVIDPGYKSYPFVIEMRSRVNLTGFISLPPWVPRSHFNVGVDHAVLTVSYPQSMVVNFRDEKIRGTREEQNGQVIRTYTVNQLAAVPAKFRYRDFFDDQPKVYITPREFQLAGRGGSNASWQDFGNWYMTLNDIPYTLTNETQAFLNGLKKNDPREVIRKIYEYMQDKTRYVSIQLGIGGFKSLPTEEVEQFGYGDCKALSTYMKNMLDFVGIRSNYILARAGRDEPDVVADFPGNQFNHVFIGVPLSQDTLLLECTSQESPYNFIGTFTDDRNVLWIERNQSKIIRSKIYDHHANTAISHWSFTLDKQGNARVNVDTKNEGVFFDELMLYQSAPTEYVTEYNHSKFEYDDFAVKNFKVDRPERAAPRFNASYVLEIKGLAKPTGDKLIVPYMPTRKIGQYAVSDDLMKYCSVKRGMTVTDEITIHLPQGYWVYSPPAPEMIESRFGSYKMETTFEATKLVIHRTFTLYKGDYRNEEFSEVKAFLQKIEKTESKKLVLNSKT